MEDLIAAAGVGAGDDQADAGTKTFEREHEMSLVYNCLLYTSPSPRDRQKSRMPSSA